MIRRIYTYDLGNYLTKGERMPSLDEMERHLIHELSSVDPKACIRLIVQNFKPIPDYLGWVRPGYVIQIETGNSMVADLWHDALEAAQGVHR